MDNNSLIMKVSVATGTDAETTQKLVQALSLAISDRVSKGDRVVMPGLGEFAPVVLPEFTEEDMLTGRVMRMPRSMQVSFTPSATLKKRLNNV